MPDRHRAPSALAVAVTGLVLALPPVASGLTPPDARAYAPVSPQTIHTQNRVDDVRLATGGDGTVVATWENGTNNGDTGFAASRPAGTWFAPAQVLKYGYSPNLVPFGGGPAGTRPVVLQSDFDLGDISLRLFDGTAFGAGHGQFSGFGATESTDAARCPDGDLVVLGRPTTTTPSLSQSIVRYILRADLSAGTPPGSFATTSIPRRWEWTDVTCDKDGLSLYGSIDDGVTPSQLLVAPALGGLPIVNRTAAAGHSIYGAEMRVMPDGRVWVLWAEYPTTGSPVIYAATRAPGASGAAGAPVNITGTATELAGTAIDAAGRLQVLLARQPVPGEGMPVAYDLRTADPGSATLGAPVEIQPVGQHDASLLSGHPDGAPRLLVTDWATGTVSIRGIPQAGSSDPATVLPGSSAGEDAPQAFTWGPSGDLFTGTAAKRAENVIDVRIGGLDTGAPPTLDAVSVPGVAVAGTPLPVSASAADGFGVARVAWTVDGAEVASGQSAAPVIAAPGTKTVTVTATDFAGHSTSATRTVRVIDPNPPVVTVQPQPLPVVDRRAPRVRASATRARRGKAARYARVSVRLDEKAAVNLELIGSLRRGKQRGTLILRSSRIKSLSANRSRVVKLTIPASLAKLVYRGKLQVRVIATDAAGNRRTATVTVKRSGKKSKRSRR